MFRRLNVEMDCALALRFQIDNDVQRLPNRWSRQRVNVSMWKSGARPDIRRNYRYSKLSEYVE